MNDMERELETMLGIQAGITITLAALVSTHPDYAKLQLTISRLIEHAAPKALWPILSERQRDVANRYVEFLQQIKEAPQADDPLTQLGFPWKSR